MTETNDNDRYLFVVDSPENELMDHILYKNSQNRDYTINSLFLEAFCLDIYDCNTGIEDLEARMVF